MRSSRRCSLPSRTDLRAAAPTSTTTRVIGLSSSGWKSIGLSIRIVSSRKNVATRKQRQRWISGHTREKGWRQKSCGRRSIRMWRQSLKMREASCVVIGSLRILIRIIILATSILHLMTVAVCSQRPKIRWIRGASETANLLISHKWQRTHHLVQQWPLS